VYLYLTAALIILAIVMHGMYLRGIAVNNWMLWGGLIGAIALIFVVFKFGTDPTQPMLNHFLVLALVIVTGVMMYPSYKSLKNNRNDVIRNSLLITGSLFMLLTFLSYNNPQYFNPENYKYLVYALIGLILVEIAVFWFMSPSRKVRTFIVFLGALLFALFIAYDTRMLLERKNMCQIPNYPVAMIDIFYDIINLFLRVASLTQN
jgi:FtsH-binding integral membrane protein